MKLYSRKHFILGLICGLLIIFEGKHYDGAKSVIWIAFFTIQGFRCIYAAFSKQTLEQEEVLAVREKRVLEKMGPLWKIPMLVVGAPILAGAAAFSLLWPSDIGGILLFVGMIASLAAAIWFRVRYNELMEQEERKEEQENNEETKS